MLDLGFLLVIALWSSAVGVALLHRLIEPPDDLSDALALAMPLGLGVLSLSALALGVFGYLTPVGLAIVLGAGVGLVTLERRIIVKSLRMDIHTRIKAHPEFQVTRLVGLGFDLALAAVVAGTLLVALTPVTDGDALCYHLQVPKVFLVAHATTYEPDLHETVYPLVAEMLYAVALVFRGPVACRLLQWLLGLVLAANVTAMARPILGARARWAGTVVLLAPVVSNGMAAPLNDVALAAFANAALFALTLWWSGPASGAAVLTGVLGGLAIGVKYPALIWVGLLGTAMLARGAWSGVESIPAKSVFKHFSLFTIATLLIGGGWYVRAYSHTGNPVFPYFRGVFGAGLDEVLEPSWRPLAVTPWNLLTAIGPMTLQPDRFDSLAHQFGPVFLLMLPGLFLIRAPFRGRLLAGFGLAFLGLCLTQRQSMRFVIAAIGPLSVGVAWLAWAWVHRGRAGRSLVCLLILMMAAEAALALGRSRQALGVLTGRESASSYLARREPTWRVGRWIDANLPASARIVGQDHRGFYLPRPYTMELAHRRRTGLGRHDESADAIVFTLRARGFTHLLMCPPEPVDAVEFDPTLSRRLEPWLAARLPVFDQRLADSDGVVRRYTIYDLNEPTRTARAAEVRR